MKSTLKPGYRTRAPAPLLLGERCMPRGDRAWPEISRKARSFGASRRGGSIPGRRRAHYAIGGLAHKDRGASPTAQSAAGPGGGRQARSPELAGSVSRTALLPAFAALARPQQWEE